LPEGYERPTWAYSAVCPNGYDYVQPWCKQRTYTGEPPSKKETEQVPFGPWDVQLQRAITLSEQSWEKAQSFGAKADFAAISSALALATAFATFVLVIWPHIKRRNR
jgi:hypothetical protein